MCVCVCACVCVCVCLFVCVCVCACLCVWTGLWLHSRCSASERCLNMCGSVYGDESAYSLPVECVGVFLVLRWFLSF